MHPSVEHIDDMGPADINGVGVTLVILEVGPSAPVTVERKDAFSDGECHDGRIFADVYAPAIVGGDLACDCE